MNEMINRNKENEIFNFEFEGHQIRSILINGDPWFVGKDLALALEYKDSSSALRSIDDEDKKMGGFGSAHLLMIDLGEKSNLYLLMNLECIH